MSGSSPATLTIYFLALLFSVDDDDPVTTGVDESGGLNPNMIYASFLTGGYFELLTEPLDDDIDALACWYRSLKSCPFSQQDTYSDGEIDFLDFSDLSDCYQGPDKPWSPSADFDKCLCLDCDDDGNIDFSDLHCLTKLWLQNFGP